MEEFMKKHEKSIIGSLSGFDRLVFRGTLRSLAVTCGMMDFLHRVGVLLKDFGAFVEKKTKELKEASLAEAERLNRPIIYLPSSQDRKEELAHAIMERDGIQSGLICVLKCVEPCISYDIERNRQEKKLILNPSHRKCLHLYHYMIDEDYGFMNARIQTWFPFTIQVCVNGREWLMRQMDQAGMKYVKSNNCFLWIEDVVGAQELMDQQLQLDFPSKLNKIRTCLNPAFDTMFSSYRTEYYWTVYQSEWATDLMFDKSSSLASIYPQLVRGSMTSFSSPDVMRFLGGRKLTVHFKGEVVSDYKAREEGIRVKHRVKANSVKMYDKEGSVLRVETTINNPSDFKSYRTKEGDPDGKKDWRKMRKGVADIHGRAKVSQACNERYLEALASLDTDKSIYQIVNPSCASVKWKKKNVRALHPWTTEDRTLLQSIGRGEFKINGFRNRDLLPLLFSGSEVLKDKKKYSAKVTRQIRLLRGHGLVKKVSRSHRYMVTKKGNEVISSILGYQELSLEQLRKVA